MKNICPIRSFLIQNISENNCNVRLVGGRENIGIFEKVTTDCMYIITKH